MSTLAKINEAKQLLEDAGYVVFAKAEKKTAHSHLVTTPHDGPNDMLKEMSECNLGRIMGERLLREGFLRISQEAVDGKPWLVTRRATLEFFPAGK